jgi:histidine phosphotransferase ChpT
MQQTMDIRVFELLSSRLCHDVVGPVGAINNGMEFLEDEEDPSMAAEAIGLVGTSARQAANALQFYRMAYGRAGSQIGADLSELAGLAARRYENSKVKVTWRDLAVPDAAGPDLGKLLLNLVALASECLPRGGDVVVEIDTTQDGNKARVTAAGANCAIRDDSVEALADEVDIEALTPRNVQGFFTKTIARRMGSDLEIDTTGEDRVSFAVSL